MASWKYIKKQPFEKNKNSIQDGFFHSSTEVRALVRESIQNSLDAQLDDDVPVKIKFSIRDGSNSLSYSESARWFDSDSWNHYSADNNGLVNPPNKRDNCNYLIIEDFNTTGLNGDIGQDSRKVGVEHPFYSFFRAEGESGKLNKLGSHGLGKIVFPMCSRIRSIFALTTRSKDNKTYLVGQSTLKFHQIDGITFHPDGWYGAFRGDGFQLPIDSDDTINDFRDVFKLTRKDNEAGLSIVIPWANKDITHEEIIKCIVEEYYPSIMGNVLEAEVVSASGEIVSLKQDTLLDLICQIDKLDTSIKLKIDLATEFYTSPYAAELQSKGNLTVVNCPSDKKHEWSAGVFSNNSIQKIAANLEDGVAIIRVPIIIYEKECKPSHSFFHVILKRVEVSIKPTFIRDKLIITEATRYTTPEYIAIIIIKDTALTKFLGDSENPAHTKWDVLAQNFKGKYDYGANLVQYVKLSAKKILEGLQSEDEKIDSTTLSSFFSVQRAKLNEKHKKQRRGQKTTKVVIPKIVQGKTYFKEDSLNDGFKVTGAENLQSLREFTIYIAYDLLRGDAFKKWNSSDFDLNNMIIDERYITNLSILNNKITFNSDNKDFYINVKGFDSNRDLKISTKSLDIKNA